MGRTTQRAPVSSQNGPVAARVFIVDDHEVVRRGVRDLLESEEGFVIAGEAATAAETLAAIPVCSPEVVVLDVRLPDGDGVDVCREIRSRYPEIRCLVLTAFDEEDAFVRAVMAGADGYVLKVELGERLVDGVRRVAQGESILGPTVASRLLERLRGGASDQVAPLSEQERLVLDLIGQGLTNRQIGERLFLAEKTVKNYVSRLLMKLGLARRTEAAAYVTRLSAERRRPGREPGAEL